MPAAKIAISIRENTLRHLDRLVRSRNFRTRSEAIQQALDEKLNRLQGSRLAQECAKLSRKEERALAETGLSADAKEWPAY
ncbi:MAG: ribbon-helix-helix domain-containing protein [Verrucomicrobiota bacterium]|nr:ribbon-helix-helix domain-containing protein [Verrucomicrobiota bacterium]